MLCKRITLHNHRQDVQPPDGTEKESGQIYRIVWLMNERNKFSQGGLRTISKAALGTVGNVDAQAAKEPSLL